MPREKSVAVLRFETLQPEDARHDGVAALLVDLDDFPGRAAAPKFHPGRPAGTDFFATSIAPSGVV